MTVQSSTRRRSAMLAGIALVCLVAVTFFPIPSFEFVGYDAREQVADNPTLRKLTVENVARICTSRCITSYYPVRTLTYMVDCQLWGLKAGGFKFTNCLIHLANVLLLFWLVLRLLRANASQGCSPEWSETASAGIVAGLFAVHPVVVEAVVWVPGREELLMTLGALGSIHLHITARHFGEQGAKTRQAIACHMGVVLCCVAACLSNAVAATIPALVTAWDILYLSRPKVWKIVRGTGVLWIVGAATIVIKQSSDSTKLAGQPDLFSAQQLMLVVNVYWLNLRTVIWPTGLGFDYSKATPGSFLDTEVLLGGIAIGLTLAVLLAFRRQKGLVFGLLWFVVALGPSSQIMTHHIHRADRFLYLPLAGIVLALGMTWQFIGSRLRRPAVAGTVLALGIVTVLALETLATRQVWTWQDEISACEHSLRVNHGSPRARCALADLLVRHGQYQRAAETYRDAVTLHPEDARILANYAWLLASCDDRELRDQELAIELTDRACQLSQWKIPEFLQSSVDVYLNSAKGLAEQGEFERATGLYDKTLRLALLLQSGPKNKLRHPHEAVHVAEEACRLMQRPTPDHLGMLADVYAKAGWREQSIHTLKKAIEQSQADGNPEQTGRLKRQLESYRDVIHR